MVNSIDDTCTIVHDEILRIEQVNMADVKDSARGTKIIIKDGVMVDSFVKINRASGLEDLKTGANTYINSGILVYT